MRLVLRRLRPVGLLTSCAARWWWGRGRFGGCRRRVSRIARRSNSRARCRSPRFGSTRALHEVALRVAAARGYVPGVTQVSFFVPAEVVACELGMHRATLYRQLPRLEKLGVVHARAHRTTYNGRVVADGTVWA